MVNNRDRDTIGKLASRVAEIAALPLQEEKRDLWRKLNALEPVRPMVAVDQVCWNELGDDLAVSCQGPDCRGYEGQFRRTLFQWRHFPVDMLVEPFVRVHKAARNTRFGIGVEEDVAVSDPTNSVVGHMFRNQFATDAELDKARTPEISHDETERRPAVARELFDGILDVRCEGVDPDLSLWDPISTWMGVQNVLYALIDRPAFMHKLVGRVTDGYQGMLDQLEEQGLLCGPQSLIHCTGVYTDELPAPGYNPAKPSTRDLWMFGLVQMFSTVSPDMFKEFEVDYASRICARFGLVYYGCCDPPDRKMAEVRMIPGVRKVSMNPWADEERGAAEIGGDFVYSRKPNPAFLAPDRFNPDLVRRELESTRTWANQPKLTGEQWEQPREEIEAFRDHAALLSWYMADEPSADRVPTLEKIRALLREIDPCHPLPGIDLGQGPKQRCPSQDRRGRNTRRASRIDHRVAAVRFPHRASCRTDPAGRQHRPGKPRYGLDRPLPGRPGQTVGRKSQARLPLPARRARLAWATGFAIQATAR